MFRPFSSGKQRSWYYSNKRKGTVPKSFFKMRFMKTLAPTVVPFAPVSGSKGIGPWGGK